MFAGPPPRRIECTCLPRGVSDKCTKEDLRFKDLDSMCAFPKCFVDSLRSYFGQAGVSKAEYDAISAELASVHDQLSILKKTSSVLASENKRLQQQLREVIQNYEYDCLFYFSNLDHYS